MDAIKQSMPGAAAPPSNPGQAAASFAEAMAAEHKKANPTLYSQNGAFDWSKAMAPNQGWNTMAQPADVQTRGVL